MNPTLYDVLGVSRDATGDEIRQAWRRAADRFQPGEEGSTRQFRLFNEAAEVLLDTERRRTYDATLPAEVPAAVVAAHEPAASTRSGDDGAATLPGPPIPGASGPVTTRPAVVESAAGPHVVPATEGGPRRPGAPLAVLAVLALLAVTAAAWFGSRGWQAYQEEKQAEDYQLALDRAPAAAEAAAAAVLSYDHRSLEADRDAAAKFLTDGYREEYVSTFDELVRENATKARATVEAEVLASAPMNSSREEPDRIPVLLFVNQTTTSTASAEPSVALNRVRLDMVEVDGTWLVDGITSY